MGSHHRGHALVPWEIYHGTQLQTQSLKYTKKSRLNSKLKNQVWLKAGNEKYKNDKQRWKEKIVAS